MIIVHHLVVGRSLFTVWLLEELGLEYRLEIYHRNPDTMRAPEALKKVHPLGKSPVIEDAGRVIAESGAIAAYLVEKYDTGHKLAPSRADETAWVRFVQWLHYPEGSMFTPLLLTLLLKRAQQPPGVIDAFASGEIALHFQYLTTNLGDQDYIFGESLSAVDIGLGYMVSMGERVGLLGPYPKLQAYVARIRTRPAFQRAFEKTGG